MAMTAEPRPLLYWSRGGRVACVDHAPAPDSPQWLEQRWQEIPDTAYKHQIAYQCQECAGRPIGHRPAAARMTAAVRPRAIAV
jgi:hypothetical protein